MSVADVVGWVLSVGFWAAILVVCFVIYLFVALGFAGAIAKIAAILALDVAAGAASSGDLPIGKIILTVLVGLFVLAVVVILVGIRLFDWAGGVIAQHTGQ